MEVIIIILIAGVLYLRFGSWNENTDEDKGLERLQNILEVVKAEDEILYKIEAPVKSVKKKTRKSSARAKLPKTVKKRVVKKKTVKKKIVKKRVVKKKTKKRGV
jgi:hypothetical protein